MFRLWKFILLVIVSMLLLASCGQPPEEKAADGINAAGEAFYANDKNPTEEIDGVKLYKPAGFTISENSDGQNIVFRKGKDTFILFINPNEQKDSQLFYDLLEADESKNIIDKESFTEDGVSGFAAVVQGENGYFELIASVGGAKMTTLTKERKTVGHLTQMMEVVRSIQ